MASGHRELVFVLRVHLSAVWAVRDRQRADVCPWRCSGRCGLLVSSAYECGDCVATQGKSDHHDCADMRVLALAIPHCTVVATEKRRIHAARQAGLNRRYGADLCGSLVELDRALDRLISGDRPDER